MRMSPLERTDVKADSVLLVDDDPDLRLIWRVFLTSSGVDVRVATNGDEALAQLASWVPDVILTDVDMPGMNGLELVEAVRSCPDLAAVPVVMVTGRPSHAVRAAALARGATEIIAKTAGLADIERALDDALTRGAG